LYGGIWIERAPFHDLDAKRTFGTATESTFALLATSELQS